ncbi:hypothetical protein L218DRAFT_850593 [Marasmius fiardii PR-910]|nr:hypothetical protein L218DRAFT_850593 [Marasmius fiardii PR-910]
MAKIDIERAPSYAQVTHLLHTIFLFTRNDYPLVFAPNILTGMVLAAPTDLRSFAVACVWLNLHLLAFNIQNQLVGVEEDRLCKPYRPFPSGRITVKNGRLLYLVVVAASIAWSYCNDLVLLSVIYSCGTTLYNELGLAADPFLKTPMGGIAYICYSWGTTFILGHHQPLSTNSLYAIMMSGLIFSLTGHMQDFRDRSGDALMGRRTIPIILTQRVARWSLLCIIATFTYGLIVLWSPPVAVTVVFTALFLITVVTLVATHSEEADRVNFHWYEVNLISI